MPLHLVCSGEIGYGRWVTEEPDGRLDAILDAVTAASRVLMGIAARALDRSKADITLSQCRLLGTLAQRGPMNLVGLARALQVNPSTATRMCDRLVAKGLLVRDRAEGGVLLRPSTAGLEVVEAVAHERRAQLQRIVSQLDERQQDELLRCMEAFRGAAGDLAEGQGALGVLSDPSAGRGARRR
ncbi:MAG: MarR family transcriptional regulator [Actinobacteria bacterium]|nr:MarR family transcriptional regulator [Actinomycetota bacterium]